MLKMRFESLCWVLGFLTILTLGIFSEYVESDEIWIMDTSSTEDYLIYTNGSSRSLIVGNTGFYNNEGVLEPESFSIDNFEVVKARFHVKFGEKNPSVNFSYGEDSIKFSFVGYGLYDPDDNDYAVITNHNNVVPSIVGNYIVYDEIVENMTVSYTVNKSGISKLITFNKKSRDSLPISFSNNTFIVFAEKIEGDYPDVNESWDVMSFKNTYIPKETNVYKKIFSYQGNNYLLTALRFDIYNSSDFPFSIDPSLELSAISNNSLCGDWDGYDDVNLTTGGVESVTINIGCAECSTSNISACTWNVTAYKNFWVESGVILTGNYYLKAGGFGPGGDVFGKCEDVSDCNNYARTGSGGGASYGDGGRGGAPVDTTNYCCNDGKACKTAGPGVCLGYPVGGTAYTSSYSYPVPGSGGGNDFGGSGRAGIYIRGGYCFLNGTFDFAGADGSDATAGCSYTAGDTAGGGGGGGDIWIKCDDLELGAKLHVHGGAGGDKKGACYAGGGGGGGRIKILFNDNHTVHYGSLPVDSLFNYSGGSSGVDDATAFSGGEGYFLTDNYFGIPPDAVDERTIPSVPVLGDIVWLNVLLNDTDYGSEGIDFCDFTLISPNGSAVIDFENGTYEPFIADVVYDTNWSSRSVTIDDSGRWYWNFTYYQSDNASVTNSSVFDINMTIADSSAPNINITYPDNDTNHDVSNLELNWTVFDNGHVRSCWFEYNDGDEYKNSSIVDGDGVYNNFTYANISSFGISWITGLNNVTVYCNDSSSNENLSDMVSFTIRYDTIAPVVTFTIPASNGSTVSAGSYTIEGTVADSSTLDRCWYEYWIADIDTVIIKDNITGDCVNTGSFSQILPITLDSEHWYEFRVYANDTATGLLGASASNWDSTNVTIYAYTAPVSTPPGGGGGGGITMAIVPFCGDGECQSDTENIFNCRADCATLSRLQAGDIFKDTGNVVVQYIIILMVIVALLLTISQKKYARIGFYLRRKAGLVKGLVK